MSTSKDAMSMAPEEFESLPEFQKILVSMVKSQYLQQTLIKLQQYLIRERAVEKLDFSADKIHVAAAAHAAGLQQLILIGQLIEYGHVIQDQPQ